jgi:hypothetical protein
MTLSIALALSVALLSLASSDSTAQAQPGRRRVADTGIVSINPNQMLRLTLFGDADGDRDVDGADFLVFRRMEYGQESCSSDGVCKLVVASQTTSNPIRLRPGEAVSFTCLPASVFGVRVVVLSNRRNVRATATITNIITGETTSHIIMYRESDFQ